MTEESARAVLASLGIHDLDQAENFGMTIVRAAKIVREANVREMWSQAGLL